MRYRFNIAYNGNGFAGWQRQPTAPTIQQEIESKLSTIFNRSIDIVGCGRTDTGVHASQYVFHADLPGPFDFDLRHRLNQMLSQKIVIREVLRVSDKFHARFDAARRTYRYYLIRNKSPFYYEIKTHFPRFDLLDKNKLQACAALIKPYSEFAPFCKSRSDSETMTCQIFESQWTFNTDEYYYTISANRFLRGMVRLIVGISLRVAIGEVALQDVRDALDTQTRLEKSYSAPAQGLFLTEVTYHR